MNWNKSKKPGASFGPKRQLALKLARRDKIPATEKQKAYMQSLGIPFPDQVTKVQAMHMISSTLDKLRRLESSLADDFNKAIDRDKT